MTRSHVTKNKFPDGKTGSPGGKERRKPDVPIFTKTETQALWKRMDQLSIREGNPSPESECKNFVLVLNSELVSVILRYDWITRNTGF